MLKKITLNATAGLHIHVGGGDEHKLDPLGYVVKECDGKPWFYRIDAGAMMSQDRTFADTFVKYTEQQNSIGRLRALIHEAFDPDKKDTWFHRSSVSKSFYETYKSKVTDMQIKNQLLVQCMPITMGNVYVPGSSIKGAMRTAVLDRLAGKNNYETVNEAARKRLSENKRAKFSEVVEKHLLNYEMVQDDPFKALRISDAYLPDDSTVIVEVKNVLRNGKSLSMDMFIEAIKPGTKFQFSMAIEDTAGLKGRNIGNYYLTHDKLLKTCRNFYYNVFVDEVEKFYTVGSPSSDSILDILDEIYDENEEFIPGMYLLRLGRFSHLESMSYNDRGEGKLCEPSPPIDPRTKKNKPYSTTRNLVDGKYPLGALVLTCAEI